MQGDHLYARSFIRLELFREALKPFHRYRQAALLDAAIALIRGASLTLPLSANFNSEQRRTLFLTVLPESTEVWCWFISVDLWGRSQRSRGFFIARN